MRGTRHFFALTVIISSFLTVNAAVGAAPEALNPSFERDGDGNGVPDGWRVRFGEPTQQSVRIVSEPVRIGNSAVEMQDLSPRQSLSLESRPVRVRSAQVVKASIWCYAKAGEGRMYLNFHSEGGKRLKVKEVRSKSVGAWERLELEDSAPAGAPFFKLSLYVAMANVSTCIFDDLVVSVDSNPIEEKMIMEEPPEVRNPLNIGNEEVLFIDPATVESTDRILRAFHQPEKRAEPVLGVDTPWEGMTTTLPCVLYDEKETKFRMWYSTFFIPEEFRRKGEVPGDDKLSSRICYAESNDGVHWEKPRLGLFKFDGQDTNVVLEEMVGWRAVSAVLELPEKARLGRFILYRANPDNLYVSDDGIRWKQVTNMSYRSDSGSLMYDPKRNRLVWCVKTGGQRYDGTWEGHAVGMALMEKLPEAVSKNAWQQWPPKPVFIPDEEDDLDARSQGFTNRGFYMWTGWPYGSAYLGWLWRYDRWIPPHPHDGPLYMELVYSPDGENWKRIPERPVILPYGDVGDFDSSHALTCNPPIRVGDELWIYYAGSEATHGWNLDSGIQWKGGRMRHAIGVAKWRLDGFMSLDAIGVGSFTTRPFVFEGRTLNINFKSPNGFVKVGIIDENEKAFADFSPADCDQIQGDSVRQLVSWKGNSDVSALAGKPVRLRFEMMHAAVYSFQFR
jgi:hypothetical protein